MKRLTFIFIILSLLIPASVRAQSFGLIETEHLKLALAHWGAVPCPSVNYLIATDEQFMPHVIDPTSLAYTMNIKKNGYCEIAISQRFSNSFTYNYLDRCAVMVHEVGHLHNREHSTDPSDPMFPHLLGMTRYPTKCYIKYKQRKRGCERKRTIKEMRECFIRWDI